MSWVTGLQRRNQFLCRYFHTLKCTWILFPISLLISDSHYPFWFRDGHCRVCLLKYKFFLWYISLCNVSYCWYTEKVPFFNALRDFSLVLQSLPFFFSIHWGLSAFQPNDEILETMKYMCLTNWQTNWPIIVAPYLSTLFEKVWWEWARVSAFLLINNCFQFWFMKNA